MSICKPIHRGWPALALMLLAVGCGADERSPAGTDATRVASSSAAAKRTPGYLAPAERPDSVALVPAPPAEGSGHFAADLEAYRETRALRGTARWDLAAADANLKFPHAANVFACALGVPITESSMPNLYELLQRTMVDAGQSTYAAKEQYQRTRPFARFDEPTCVPEDEAVLRGNASYPSGHASAGWAWALILTEIAPDRADALLRRGAAFGESRVVCGVHWQSDVESARVVASAVVAKLHGNAAFVEQLAKAKQEVTRARAAHSAPSPACEAETRALGLSAVR